jgi:hypothetical protein
VFERVQRIVVNEDADRALSRQYVGRVIDRLRERARRRGLCGMGIVAHYRTGSVRHRRWGARRLNNRNIYI